MGEVVFQYDHQDLDDPLQSALTLSCICSEECFSYAIEAKSSEDFVHAKVLRFDEKYPGFSNPLGYLREVLKQDDYLFQPFVAQAIAVRGVPFCLVPSEVLQKATAEELYSNTAFAGPNDQIMVESIPAVGQSLIFAVPRVFIEELEMFYDSGKVCHAMTSLVKHAVASADAFATEVHVNIAHRWFEVAVVDDRNLVFANHFRWYDKNDIVYYLSAIAKEFGLDRARYKFEGALASDDLVAELAEVLSITPDELSTADLRARLADLMHVKQCV